MHPLFNLERIMKLPSTSSWSSRARAWLGCALAVATLPSLAFATPGTPADQNFESASVTEGDNASGSLTIDDLVFTANGGADVETYDISGFWGGSFTGQSGTGLIANYSGRDNVNMTTFSFGTVSGVDFRLNSLTALGNEVVSSYTYAVRYKVEGYAGGTAGRDTRGPYPPRDTPAGSSL